MITRTLVFRFPSEFELPGSTLLRGEDWDLVNQTLPANRSGLLILYRSAFCIDNFSCLQAQSNWNVHYHTPSLQHSMDVGTGKL